MKRETLALLCCPVCHAGLSLREEDSGGAVEEGHLLCSQCTHSFPIKKGIPRFIRPEDLNGLNRRFARHYDRLSYVYALFTKVAFLPMGGERKARKEILDRFELNGGRTLEVSIGPGVNLPYLFESPTVGEVFGLDISAGQLARCHRFVANFWRLLLHTAAFNLLNWLRDDDATPAELRTAQPATWRTRLIKVAATVVQSARRVVVALAGQWPHWATYHAVAFRGGAVPAAP